MLNCSIFTAMNRGFLYGDGFFETIRTVNGVAYLLPYHLKRIKDAMEILQFDEENELNEETLGSLVNAEEFPNHIIRISFYRDGEGKYAPMNNFYQTHISRKATTDTFYLPSELDLASELSKAPEHLGSIAAYPMPKPDHPLYTIKTLSSAYYVLAAKYKTENAIDHLFILDRNANILEELSSNIILQQGNSLYVPHFDNGCVRGASMRYILNTYGFQIEQININMSDLVNFDKIYLSKGSTGISRIK